MLHNPGYDDGDGLCRRDVLTVRYGRRLNPQVPAKARGFWAEPTFARLKDYPGVVDCADKRLVFFRALPLQYANEEEVARRGMALFDQARASAPNAVFDCSATRQPASCLALIRSLPVSHIRRIHDCEATPGGSCASLMVDDWDLSIETGDDGQLKKVRLFALIHL